MKTSFSGRFGRQCSLSGLFLRINLWKMFFLLFFLAFLCSLEWETLFGSPDKESFLCQGTSQFVCRGNRFGCSLPFAINRADLYLSRNIFLRLFTWFLSGTFQSLFIGFFIKHLCRNNSTILYFENGALQVCELDIFWQTEKFRLVGILFFDLFSVWNTFVSVTFAGYLLRFIQLKFIYFLCYTGGFRRNNVVL